MESNRTVLNMQIYTGACDDLGGKGHAANVALHLLRNYCNKGHSLYMDNYYNSVILARQLLERGTYCTGTLRIGRKETPEVVSKAKLKTGGSIHRYGGNVCVGKWKDKREVLYLTTEHENNFTEVTSRSGKSKMKPAPIAQYNKYMSGIDLQDQMLSYYPVHRKTIRWYKKVGMHIFDVMIYNSFMLYNKFSRPKMSFLDFRHSLVETLLVENITKENRDQPKENPSALHLSSKCATGAGGRKLRKRCRWCSKRGIRKDAMYYCKTCTDLPGLCLDPCFKDFHDNLKFYILPKRNHRQPSRHNKNLDTIGKFSGVPGLENFNQSALPSLEEIVTAVREKCEKNGGPEAYTKLEAAKDELQEYIQTNFDFEKMQQELDEKRKTGSMEEVFAKYCEKSHFVQNNFKNVTEALENCLESEERVNMKIFLNVTESLLDFMCYRDGDRIALFVAEGGFDCIQSKRDGIEKCLNDTLHHRIPKDFSLNSLPTLSIDESVCNDYTKVQACTVTVLETCKDTTPANIVDAIFKFVRRATPCKNYPVPPSVFGAHRRVTRNSVGQQLGPLYMAYDQVKQKYEPHCEKNGGQNALVEFREAMSRVEFCLQTKIMTFRQQIEPMRGFPYDYFCTTLRRDIRSCLVNITDKIEACSSKAETYVPKLGLELYDSVYNFYCKDDAKSLKNFLNKQDTCINKAQNSTSYCVGKTKHVKAYATDAVVTKSELCSDLKIIRGCYKDIAIQTCPSNKVANEFAESLSDAIYAPCAASRITTNLIIFITIFFITKLF